MISVPAFSADINALPTMANTPTDAGWSTPTGYRTPTGHPAGAMPCTVVPNTPAYYFPTIDYPELGTSTPTPVNTPTPTTTPNGSDRIKVNANITVSDKRAVTPWGTLSCTNEFGTRIDVVAAGDSASATIYGGDITCLGYVEFRRVEGWNYNNITASINVGLSNYDNDGSFTAYVDMDNQFTLNSGSDVISQNDSGTYTLTLSYTPAIWKMGRVTSSSDYPENFYIYTWFRISNRAFVDDPTPTPTIAPETPIPCYTESYGSGSEAVATLPEWTYRYGGCLTVVPGFTIPLEGYLGLSDVVVPNVQMCVMYVDLNASFLGFQLSTILGYLVVLGLGFALFNEFRS